MNLNGWIIYNGHLPGDQFLDFSQWLQNAATSKGIQTTIYKNNALLAYLTNDSFALLGTEHDAMPDFVIFTDKDIYLARQLESLGIRVFNSAKAIEISDDKIATYQCLAQKKLSIPKTIIAPKVFSTPAELDIKFTEYVMDTLSFPMVIKEAFGSFGEQVYLIHSHEELLNKVKKLGARAFVFQEFISSSYGRDMRLHVVGDEVVASMLRKSANDFRANITAGGKMEHYHPTDEEKDLAISATKSIGADFAGVDLLFGPDHSPIICEINSNAHIRNMFDCTNINVADFIIDHIINALKAK